MSRTRLSGRLGHSGGVPGENGSTEGAAMKICLLRCPDFMVLIEAESGEFFCRAVVLCSTLLCAFMKIAASRRRVNSPFS